MNTRNIVLCILYLFLVPMGGFAQSEVVVLYPDTENKDLDEAVYQKIFLAGTIDMGKSVDWQKATCDWFRALPEGRYLLFNPRRDKGLSGEMSDFEHQVNWELEHLEKADLIIMNILASSKSPITLLEMGLFMRSGKWRLICEPGFYRYDNVRLTCARYGVPLYQNMDDFLLKQIDEFRDKAQQLQDLINTKETKVRELQLLVDERESKATKLQMELDERQREADSLVGNVEEQVDKLIKKIEVQQNDNTEDIKNALDGMSQDFGQMTKELTGAQQEISEKIHTENVKCYRNIQGLMQEFAEKMEKVDLADESMKSIKHFFGWTIGLLVCNLAALAGVILYFAGVFSF